MAKLKVKSISSFMAKEILRNLHRSCLTASREAVDRTGYDLRIDAADLSIDPMGDEIHEIEFTFSLKITVGQTR